MCNFSRKVMNKLMVWMVVFSFWRIDDPYAQSWLIQNGKVIDGTGKSFKSMDILIEDGLIKKTGRIKTRADYKIIDAQGRVVCPGFIDTHAHGDPLATPGFSNFLSMGVTTIILGQDGESPLYRDMQEWFTQVEKKGIGLNLGVLAGHGTLRFVTGVKFKMIPEQPELDSMKMVLQSWLSAGCLGMSTGLEYVPGRYAQPAELHALAKMVGEHKSIIMSHMRNEDDDQLVSSINELLEQGKYCQVHIAHFKDVYGQSESRAEQLLDLIQSHPNGKRLTADIYPYTASYTGIGIVFPGWSLPPANYDSVKLTRRPELLQFLKSKVNKRNGPSATLLGSGMFKGMTLKAVADSLNKPFEEVLADDIGPDGASGAYFVMNESLQQRLMQWPRTMICSDGSPGMFHPRGYGSFTRIIEEFVLNRKALSLEEAIHKMTLLPAKTLKLTKRGRIKKNYAADLVMFYPDQIKTIANFSDPHQLSQGIDYVMVNGVLVKDRAKTPEVYPGMILKRKNKEKGRMEN